ncbi:MAG: FtsQ-type POTRA domain-containing protein [Actinomycetota bacterium]
MTTIEPRVAERRRGVSEDRARHRLRRILMIIALIAVGVLGFWLVRSPLLSISSISVSGEEVSNPAAIIEGMGVIVGIPTIDVDAGAIEHAVESDPWIATADVSVRLPGTVSVAVTEHVALAPARSGEGWVMLSRESTVLEPIDGPRDGVFLVDIDTSTTPVGEAVVNPMVTGALEFGSVLRPDLARDAVISVDDGGLVATVGGHIVRLGRPVQLEDKALVLASLLDTELEEGAEINLIAPTRPAVLVSQPEELDPQAEVEDEE